MEIIEFYQTYNMYRSLYYTNNKELSKDTLTALIQSVTIETKQQLLNAFQNHHCWKEYDYFIYSKLLKGCENYIDTDIATYQILNAFPSKELVIVSMDIFKSLGYRINLQKLMLHFFQLYGGNPPEMSYYAYLLPTIKNIFEEEGLVIVQDSCTKEYAHLYKLHAMKFDQRITFTNFIANNELDVYNDCDSIALLFELICKRREKLFSFEETEINFILNNLSGIDPPAINYFKYFLSHMCMTANRLNSVDINFFIKLQSKCYLLLTEEDLIKVKRGVRIYTDFYNCVIKSQYKTNYTLTTKDMCESHKSLVYFRLNESGLLTIGNDLNFIASIINDTNFFLFEEILGIHDCTKVLSLEAVTNFFDNLNDDYLEDKIDVVIKLLINNWYKEEEKIFELIEMILFRMVHTIDQTKHQWDYNLYRNLKMMSMLIKQLKEIQTTKLEDCLMQIVDLILSEHCLKQNKGKLHERIIVSAIDLLVKISTNTPNLDETKVAHILTYLEKGIFCNKRYAASASGLIYRKFISSHFAIHKNFLIKYITAILRDDYHFDQSTSNMRRCLEKRILVHEFCLGLNKTHQKDIAQMICNICLEEMNKYMNLEANNDNNALKQYIFCINAIMADASLKRHTFIYIFQLIKYCLDAIDIFFKDFSICNAIYTLYATLVQRLLPYHDNKKNMHVDDLNCLCPEILNNFNLNNTNGFSERRNILLMLFLQRSNNESPFAASHRNDSFANKVINQLWEHFDQCSCGFGTESAIKLWVNLIPQKESPQLLNLLINSKNHDTKGLNYLHLKYKLLEGLARKGTFIKRREELLNCLRTSKESMQFYNAKMRIKMRSSLLEKFCLKPLTIEESIKRICCQNSTIYDKVTALEFCFDYFCHKNMTALFTEKFLVLYIHLICIGVNCFKLESFSSCFNTIVYCLDQLPHNFQQKLYIYPKSALFNFKCCSLSNSPNLLAFLTILIKKIEFCDVKSIKFDVNSIRIEVIHGYLKIATQIDSLQHDDAESLLIAFKYLKYYENITKKDLFLIAIQLLHSELLSECDYLLEHVFNALNLCKASSYVTAGCLRRFLLTTLFLEEYFKCPRERIIAVLGYIRWTHTLTIK